MEPYNNQPIDVNQMQQRAVQPVQSQNMGENQKKGNGKGTILLILILLLIIGIAVYILFAKNQLNYIQKTSTTSTTSILPSPTLAPTTTPATVDEIKVENPDTDLSGIDKDVQGL